MEFIDRIFRLIGPGGRNSVSAEAWCAVSHAAGVELPDDYKQIVETYAPVCLSSHLTIRHPDTEFFNLAAWLSSSLADLAVLDWIANDGPEYHGEVPTFGGPYGLIPVASTDRRETVFLRQRAAETGDWVVVSLAADGGVFHEFEQSFSEWLFRYLSGEEMVGRNSAIRHRDRLLVENLPKFPGDIVTSRRGPAAED
ncbi:hypothetical protein ACFU6K_01705 [Kitasatospora sp. NPDC057512]|uniref:hypothetical protein n=1 Tax=Kitasatospora sp. NPDC057512 TaxID=3346154 RepID=UPI0036C3752A